MDHETLSDSVMGAAGVDHDAHRAVGRALARKVASLSEPPMRVQALASGLRRLGADGAAMALDGLIRGALLRAPECVSAYDSLVDPEPLARILGRDMLEGMLASGLEAECIAAVQWLRGQLYEEPPRDALDPSRLIAWGLREMTLGDRRALARRARGDHITALTNDPDGGVITNLLNNPRATEQTVLLVCARRPTLMEPLLAVLRSPRWIRRYPVKMSLVRNPYLSLRFGLNLLVYLNRSDLQEIRRDESLSPILRLGAERLMDLHEVAQSDPQRR